ncbi:MAG: hypothetical protein ACE367_16905 [Acidimicrobiales bacterium]
MKTRARPGRSAEAWIDRARLLRALDPIAAVWAAIGIDQVHLLGRVIESCGGAMVLRQEWFDHPHSDYGTFRIRVAWERLIDETLPNPQERTHRNRDARSCE